jgi:hypothetical protein
MCLEPLTHSAADHGAMAVAAARLQPAAVVIHQALFGWLYFWLMLICCDKKYYSMAG